MESELIERLKNNDRSAFDALYWLYAPKLLGFALSYVKSESEAEDLVQEVFIALWQTRHNIKREDSLKSFLFMSLRNRVISLIRNKANMRIYTDYVELMEKEISDRGEPAIEYVEFEKRVLKEIEALPATQREVIKLSRFANLSHSEISDRLGLSLQTVKNALSMGLAALRKRLGNSSGAVIIALLMTATLFLGRQ